MKLVGLGVDTATKTSAWRACRASADARPLGAILTLGAQIPAGSAVCSIGLDINAAFVAFELSCGAFAISTVAKLPIGAGLTACAAMEAAFVGVEASPKASGGCSGRARQHTSTVVAALSCGTGHPTASAVCAVALGVDAVSVAIGQTGGTLALSLAADRTDATGCSTRPAVCHIIVEQRTIRIAKGVALGTRVDANTAAAGFAAWTGGAAGSTIFGIGLGVGADTVAGDFAAWTIELAGLGNANFAICTGFVACSAMRGAGLCVDTGCPAAGLVGFTGRSAYALFASISLGAEFVACAAMGGVGLGVDAGRSTKCFVGAATALAYACLAAFGGRTGFAACATMRCTGLSIDTNAAAIGFIGLAGGRRFLLACARFARFIGSTSFSARPTMRCTGLGVDASAAAIGFIGLAGGRRFLFACARFARFIGSTGFFTRPTMGGAGLRIDTRPITGEFGTWTNAGSRLAGLAARTRFAVAARFCRSGGFASHQCHEQAQKGEETHKLISGGGMHLISPN